MGLELPHSQHFTFVQGEGTKNDAEVSMLDLDGVKPNNFCTEIKHLHQRNRV